MYAKIENGKVVKYPVYLDEVIAENPDVSFPKNNWGKEVLAAFNLVEVKKTNLQKFNPDTQYPVEIEPENKNGKWEQRWQILPLPDRETPPEGTQQQKIDRIRKKRLAAYRETSDQLFFESQRGEVPQEVWLQKVAEIKALYPYD